MIVSDVCVHPDGSGEIATALLQTFARMFAQMRRSDKVRIAAGTLTWAQHGVLKALMEADHPIRVSDLAAQENMAVPSMTIATRRLEEQGLVARIPDPHDNRAVLIATTAEGKAAYDASVTTAQDALADRLKTFDDDECRALVAALPALRRLVEIAAGASPRLERLVGQ